MWLSLPEEKGHSVTIIGAISNINPKVVWRLLDSSNKPQILEFLEYLFK